MPRNGDEALIDLARGILGERAHGAAGAATKLAGAILDGTTRFVLPGQTINAVIAEAVAAGADADNRIQVIVAPGVERDFVANAYVDVVFLDDARATRYDGTAYPAAGPVLDPWMQTAPGGLVAFICDDIGTQLIDTDNADNVDLSEGVSAASYLKSLGFPCGLATPSSYPGTAGHLTAAQLRALVYANGFEVVSHSHTHTAPPPHSHAEVVQEIVSSKAALEALVDATLTPTTHMGLLVNGFVQPGDWTTDVEFVAVYEADKATALTLARTSLSELDLPCFVSVTAKNTTGDTATGAAVNFVVVGTNAAGEAQTETIAISEANLTNIANNGTYTKNSVARFKSIVSITPSAAQTGAWLYAAGVYLGDCNFDRPSKMQCDCGRTIRATYPWSTAYIESGRDGTAMHLRARSSWPASGQETIEATRAAVVGAKTLYVFHANGAAGSLPANFKTFVDALQVQVAAGKLTVVTPSALMAAVPTYSAPVAAYRNLGDFDSWDTEADAAPTLATWKYNWYLHTPAASSTITMRTDAGSGKCLELADVDARVMVKCYAELSGGTYGRVSFAAKRASGAGLITVRCLITDEYGSDGSFAIDTITPTAEWVTYERCFYVPTWAAGVQRPQIRFETTAAAVVQLDNVKVNKA